MGYHVTLLFLKASPRRCEKRGRLGPLFEENGRRVAVEDRVVDRAQWVQDRDSAMRRVAWPRPMPKDAILDEVLGRLSSCGLD